MVGISIEQFDLFGVVHHPFLAPPNMWPVGRPNSSIGSGFQIRAAKGHCIVPSALESGSTVAVRDHHPPVLALEHLENPAHGGLVKAEREIDAAHMINGDRDPLDLFK